MFLKKYVNIIWLLITRDKQISKLGGQNILYNLYMFAEILKSVINSVRYSTVYVLVYVLTK